MKGKHFKKPGKQPIFTADEERQFVECLVSLGEYGFPINSRELRHIIKNYLNRCGREVKTFKDNLPGQDWIKAFMARQPEISIRFAENVKRTRAAVDEPILRSFFENLAGELKDVPPTNIWNFDETNLTDDPGKKKVLVKKGTKYPEIIRNASKTSVSIMFCGNAAGELLPPYVVYRANKMWTTWAENGPKGCRYNASSSGWFDANIFTDWLECQMIPRLKKIDGKKVLLCDNLSSHITLHSLELCRKNDVHLICLPPNSTHLTQPLDVAFFRPLKIAWRKVLSDWKDSEEGVRNTNIQKQYFPQLLSKLMELITPHAETNLKVGFRKCGIFPLNAEEVLSRIPRTTCHPDIVQSEFLRSLETRRSALTNVKSKRRKKMNVPAGKSVCAEQSLIMGITEETSINGPTTSHSRQDEMVFDDNSSDDVDFEELSKDQQVEKDFMNFVEGKGHEFNFANVIRKVVSFVVFSYEGQLFPGEIVAFDEKKVTINAMEKSLKMWKWPLKRDELTYSWSDVLGGIQPPKQVSKRGTFSIPELASIFE